MEAGPDYHPQGPERAPSRDRGTHRPAGAVKALDLARLTQEAWQNERDKMLKTCAQFHAKSYAQRQLQMGDDMLRQADRLMAQSIEMVEDLGKI